MPDWYDAKYRAKQTTISDALVTAFCGEIARILGVIEPTPPALQEYDPELLRRQRMIIGYNGLQRRIYHSSTHNEGDVFHECVHHVLHCNDLLFTKNPAEMEISGLKIDEVMAEYTTSRKYGYAEFARKLDIKARVASMNAIKLDGYEALASIPVADRDPAFARQLLYTGVEVEYACWQIGLEEKYLALLPQGHDVAKTAITQQTFPIPGVSVPMLINGIGYLATDRANKLRLKGVKPWQLVAKIKALNGADQLDIYTKAILQSTQ